MTNLFPAWPLLSAFLLASFILAVTPGPGVLYIVTRSIVRTGKTTVPLGSVPRGSLLSHSELVFGCSIKTPNHEGRTS